MLDVLVPLCSAKTVLQSPLCGSVSKSRLLSMRCRCLLPCTARTKHIPQSPPFDLGCVLCASHHLEPAKPVRQLMLPVQTHPGPHADGQRCLEQLAASSFLPTFWRHMAMYISTSWDTSQDLMKNKVPLF